MPELVIDLGEEWDQHDEVRPPQWTLIRLKLIVALLAVLALPAASLAGASPLPRPHFTLVLRVKDVAGNTSLEPLGGVLVKQDRHGVVVFGPQGRERFRLDGQPARYHLRVADGLLIVAGQSVYLEALDLTTGEPRWRRRGFVAAAPQRYDRNDRFVPVSDGLAGWKPLDCRRDFCALDYRGQRYPIVAAMQGDAAQRIPLPHRDASLLMVEPGEIPGQLRVLDLIDPVTQASLAPAAGWIALVGWRDHGHRVDQVVRSILLRPEDGQTEVAVLNPTGVRLLGALPRDLRNCHYEAHLLVCQTADNFIEAWRVDF